MTVYWLFTMLVIVIPIVDHVDKALPLVSLSLMCCDCLLCMDLGIGFNPLTLNSIRDDTVISILEGCGSVPIPGCDTNLVV